MKPFLVAVLYAEPKKYPGPGDKWLCLRSWGGGGLAHSLLCLRSKFTVMGTVVTPL